MKKEKQIKQEKPKKLKKKEKYDELSTPEKVHGSLKRTENPMVNVEKLQLAGIQMDF